jgi:hypothetical protein
MLHAILSAVLIVLEIGGSKFGVLLHRLLIGNLNDRHPTVEKPSFERVFMGE